MSKLDAYRQKVFDVVKKIPRGKVMSYKHVAEKVGISNPRLVGRILNTNTNPKEYPCHRVVHHDGTFAEGYAFGGKNKQMEILAREGILVKNGRVSRIHFLT